MMLIRCVIDGGYYKLCTMLIIILYTNSLLTSARACNRCGLLLYDAAPSNLHVPHFFIKGTVGKLLGY